MAINYISYAAADNYRLARSKALIDLADDTYLVIQIPKYAFVRSVWLNVTVPSESGTMTVGWIGNGEVAQPAGFMSIEIAACQVAGLKIAMKDNALSFPGKYFDTASGLITLTNDSIGGDSGTCMVFAEYTVIM